jgi:uncharacterized sporulation protein YeaH/YhbH (DUF444 family)
MPLFIDRRLNPRDKNFGNRQRFLRRAREKVKEAVDRVVRERGIADAGKGAAVSIPAAGIDEPQFHHAESTGDRRRPLPGNKTFVAGDLIDKPEEGGGGGGGKQASDSGGGEDPFVFALTEEEFLDILFEDLELPDLVKASLKDTTAKEPRRAGYSNDGVTPNLNVLRTMRTSLSRRLALRRPSDAKVQSLTDEVERLQALQAESSLDAKGRQRLLDACAEIESLKRLQRAIPYIDPVDLRYNRFEPKPVPRAKAVMFCLMDVSGSMGEREKDLAKRFFILLHLFLRRKYDRVDLVFIRHTHEAKEVDEQEFFYSRESGGTVVSAALSKMLEVLRARYSVADWNVYCAQASDGDNSSSDTSRCLAMLSNQILPLCQYYAYIEILDEHDGFMGDSGKELWRGYAALRGKASHFAMKHVAKRSDIYPVFRELFAKQPAKGAAR